MDFDVTGANGYVIANARTVAGRTSVIDAMGRVRTFDYPLDGQEVRDFLASEWSWDANAMRVRRAA